MLNYSTAILSYDCTRYPFARLCEAYLGDLTSLHDERIGRLQPGAERTPFHAQLYAIGDPFLHLYRAFVRELLDVEAPAYLYQAVPSFRVHLPGNVATGNFHKDVDFGHSPESLNYIIPLTPMAQSSSVWVEGVGADGSIAPITMEVGQYLRFHGAQLTHGSYPNETGKTRVSFDFRILPKASYKPTEARSAQLGVSLTLGSYYSDGGEL